jgi:hypothetical protein
MFRCEFIYGGSHGVPLTKQTDMSKNAAFRILQWMARWKRIEDVTVIRVQPGPNDGEEEGTAPIQPKNAGYCFTGNNKADSMELMTQMTVGIPLAGFYDILKNHLKEFFAFEAPQVKLKNAKAQNTQDQNIDDIFDAWVKKQGGDVWEGRTYKAGYGRATAMGFLAIVQAYVHAAQPIPKGDNNLKNQVPFMPRTDFRTMLRIVCDTMKPTVAAKFRKELRHFFIYPYANGEETSWSFGDVSVTVKDFLIDLDDKFDSLSPDLITLGDRNRNSQIGGLGNKVERILPRSKSVGGDGNDAFIGPIVEFRSLPTLKLEALSSQAMIAWDAKGDVVYDNKAESALQRLEDKMKEIHKVAYALNH